MVEIHEESSECAFKGTCKVKEDCATICGDPGNRQSLCVPGFHNDKTCCCLEHDPPRTLSGRMHKP